MNEGLAQVFEGGQLDDGRLRIDAPNPRKRAAAKALFDSQQAIPIVDLLRAPNNEFLVTHSDSSSQKHYLQSWALTYYLIFNENLLSEKLQRYVLGSEQNPLESFQALVDKPFDEIETGYREFLQSRK